MKLAVLMLFTTLAVGQSPRTHQETLPDAPSVSQPEPSLPNGTGIVTILGRGDLSGQIAGTGGAISLGADTLTLAPEVPDAPDPQPAAEPSRIQVRSWHDTLHGKLFWAEHGTWLLATVADAEVTHEGIARHVCTEGNPELPSHPSRGQLYRYDLSFWGGFTIADLLLRKAGIPFAPYVAPMIGAGKSIHGAASWAGRCW